MATDIPKLFTTLGLSESETKIYLASLSLGPTSVQDIAKKARISRTAAYDAVATLQDRGLMSTFERGKKKLFAAEDPERAAGYFREQVHKMEEELEALNRAMPEMKLMAGGERPAVRFYEGYEGLRTLFHDVAKLAPDKLDEVSNYEDIYKHLDEKFLLEVREILKPDKMRYRVLHRGASRNPRPLVEYCELLPELGNDQSKQAPNP